MDLVPTFFIYDRTAALDEGDDPIKAIVYPKLDGSCECGSNHDNRVCYVDVYSQKPQPDITRLSNIIGSLLLVVNKLEGEICQALPRAMSFIDSQVYFLHIDKYTLALQMTRKTPTEDPHSTLELIYSIFVAFYGGFQTLGMHTTQVLRNDNCDRTYSGHWCKILHLVLHGSYSRNSNQVASISQELHTDVFKELSSRLAVLLESICAARAVVGAVSFYQDKIIFNYNLRSVSIQGLNLVVRSDMEQFGNQIQFAVNNVLVYRCHIKDNLMLLDDSGIDSSNSSCYVVIHLKGELTELSLTLIVKSVESDSDVFTRWRRTCTRIKNELFKLSHNLSDLKQPKSPQRNYSSTDQLFMQWSNQLNSMVVGEQSHALYESSSSKKLISAPVLSQRDGSFQLMTSECFNLVDVRPSVSSVHMTHVSGYNLESNHTCNVATYSGTYNPIS